MDDINYNRGKSGLPPNSRELDNQYYLTQTVSGDRGYSINYKNMPHMTNDYVSALSDKTLNKDPINKQPLYPDIDFGNLKIYLVDGNAVRNKYDINFVGGGHSYVYKYIPKMEIWVEKPEFALVFHELIEYLLMENKGMTYKEAHKEATQWEGWFRTACDNTGKNRDMNYESMER